MADAVLLVVQLGSFGAGEMAAVVAGEPAFLHADAVVGAVQAGGLGGGNLAQATLFPDAVLLVVQPMVHLDPARVMRLPGRGRSGARRAQRKRHADRGQEGGGS